MQMYIILIFAIGLIYIMSPWLMQNFSQRQHGGNLGAYFSEITDDISKGNAVSWSNRKNSPGPHAGNEFADQPAFTFWGSGIPLIHETRLGIPDPVIRKKHRIETLSSANLRCSPECCPSPYSCDHGCLCFRRNRQGGPIVGPTLRKNFADKSWP